MEEIPNATKSRHMKLKALLKMVVLTLLACVLFLAVILGTESYEDTHNRPIQRSGRWVIPDV